MRYDPARYAPGTPWASHDWGWDPMWLDSAEWCIECGAASYKDEAYKPCPGQSPTPVRAPSSAVLLAPVGAP